LGVCLLEIGLWESFASEPKHAQFKEWLEAQGFATAHIPSFYLKEYFEEQAKTILPERAGDKYSGIVVKCLTCLDEITKDGDGSSDNNEVADPQQSMVTAGVKFIQTILLGVDELFI
jgi:hypothetical protein